MIQITVRDIFNDNFTNVPDEGIYIFRDGEHVFYVGQSIDIGRRLHEHLLSTAQVGDLVRLNWPKSLSWQVEIMTVEECQPYVLREYPKSTSMWLDTAERVLIRYYHPSLNGKLNFSPSKLPAHIKRRELEPGATDNLY